MSDELSGAQREESEQEAERLVREMREQVSNLRAKTREYKQALIRSTRAGAEDVPINTGPRKQ